MTEIGYVASIHGEYASVVFQRRSGCGENCAHCKAGCEVSSVTTDIKNTLGAKRGDKVKVEMNQKAFNTMLLWVYIFPLIMLALGISIGTKTFQSMGFANYELLSFFVGILALAISYFILNKYNKRASKNDDYTLQMTSIIEN